ncbi:MAG: hypothetical protein WKF47_17775 [Geodermatophilaceae bacterium]
MDVGGPVGVGGLVVLVVVDGVVDAVVDAVVDDEVVDDEVVVEVDVPAGEVVDVAVGSVLGAVLVGVSDGGSPGAATALGVPMSSTAVTAVARTAISPRLRPTEFTVKAAACPASTMTRFPDLNSKSLCNGQR